MYYQPHSVKTHDAFLVVCTIASSPSTPPTPPLNPRHLVPRDLLDAVGSLLDDPLYSDVEFVLPRRSGSAKGYRTIKAAKRLLQRVDYFDTSKRLRIKFLEATEFVRVFNSGFAEANDRSILNLGTPFTTRPAAGLNDEYNSGTSASTRQFEDSDDEDEGLFMDADDLDFSDTDLGQSRPLTSVSAMSTTLTEDESDEAGFADTDDGEQRNVRPKLTHPSSPRATERTMDDQALSKTFAKPMSQVIVHDTSYSTYRAVLYYASR